MDRIVCEWCHQENKPKRTHCESCGAPLHVKDLVGSPFEQPIAPPPPLPFDTASPVATPLPTFRPPQRRTWPWAIVGPLVFVIFIAVGIGVTHYKAHKSASTHGSSTSTTSKPKPQWQTVDGLNGLLTDIRNHFGDTMGYDIYVEPDYATITRADPNNNRHTQTYANNGDNWTLVSSSDSSGGEFVTDLSKFDVAAVIAKLAGAPQALGITDVKKIRLMIRGLADLGPTGFSTTTGTLTPQIWVDDQTASGGDAYMDLNPDGSIKGLHPSS